MDPYPVPRRLYGPVPRYPGGYIAVYSLPGGYIAVYSPPGGYIYPVSGLQEAIYTLFLVSRRLNMTCFRLQEAKYDLF